MEILFKTVIQEKKELRQKEDNKQYKSGIFSVETHWLVLTKRYRFFESVLKTKIPCFAIMISLKTRWL